MDIKLKIADIAKSKDQNLDEFCSWLLTERDDSGKLQLKTMNGITFKSTGDGRCYNFYAKFESEPDDKYVCYNLFRD